MSLQDDLIIRPLHPDDAADQYAIVSDPRVALNLMQLPTMEITQTQKWIERPSPGQHRLVAELDGRVIGAANIRQSQRARTAHSGRLGIMVHPDFWGQGVGGALMTAVLDLADNWLNLLRVELEVYTHNEAAIRLYEKMGFAREGMKAQSVFGDGRYFDLYVMARLRHADWYASQPPPPPLPARRGGPATAVIRPPRYPDDVDDLYTLYHQPAVGRTTLQLPSQEIWITHERLQAPNPHIYRLVAEVDGRVVGNATLNQKENPRARHVAGLGMAVHPDYWGRGIGGQLMAGLMDLADNWLQLGRVELEVNTDNPAAVRLYEKFGFQVEGRHKMHAYGDGRMVDSYFMARLRR